MGQNCGGVELACENRGNGSYLCRPHYVQRGRSERTRARL